MHDAIWRDEGVKNVHYILMPKPWMEDEPGMSGKKVKVGEGRDVEEEMVGEEGEGKGEETEEGKKGGEMKERDETHEWWWEVNRDRLRQEAVRGIITDGF